MERGFRRVLATVLVAFTAVVPDSRCCAQEQNKPNAAAADHLDEMLGWLPADTETLIVARGPFHVEVLPSDFGQDGRIDRIWPRAACGLLASIDDGRFVEPLKNHAVALAVQGSRHFRAPTDLGIMRFAGCQIIRFEDDLKEDGQRLMRELQESAASQHTISGTDVAEFAEKFNLDVWQIFVARPKPELLVVATDEKYLQEVLSRMTGADRKTRAFAAGIPEWKHVDKRGTFWAMRHFDRNDAGRIQNSLAQIANDPGGDPEATGLTFQLSADRQVAKVVYLGGDAVIRALERSGFSLETSKGAKFDVRAIGDGAVEFSLRLEDRETDGYFLLMLLHLLGHSVVL